MIASIKTWWLRLRPETRDHVISATRVFVSTFVVVSGAAIRAVGIDHLTVHLLIAAVTAGAGAAVSALLKFAIQTYAPPSLGGRAR